MILARLAMIYHWPPSELWALTWDELLAWDGAATALVKGLANNASE